VVYELHWPLNNTVMVDYHENGTKMLTFVMQQLLLIFTRIHSVERGSCPIAADCIRLL